MVKRIEWMEPFGLMTVSMNACKLFDIRKWHPVMNIPFQDNVHCAALCSHGRKLACFGDHIDIVDLYNGKSRIELK